MNDKDLKLTKEELEILREIRSGATFSVMEKGDKKLFANAATKTLNKKKKKVSINLRIDEGVVARAKAIAEREGMGYQTLLGSVIHKWVNAAT